MESLRKIFGLRDEDEMISVLLVLSIVFLVVLFLMRGCWVDPTGSIINDGSITLPSPNTPIIRSDLEDGNVQITGTSGAEDEVDVYVDGILVGTAVADELGQWAINTEVVKSGEHEIWLQTKLADGSDYQTEPIPFDVDLESVSDGNSISGVGSAVEYLPSRSEPEIDDQVALVEAPTLSIERDDRNRIIPLVGTGAPGATLLLALNGNNIRTIKVADDGTWSAEITRSDTIQDYDFVAKMVDEGNHLLATSNSDRIIFQKVVSEAVVEATPEPEPEPEPISAEINLAAPDIDLAAINVGADGNPAGDLPIGGEGAPAGARVILYLDGVEIGETTINDDGTYNYPYSWNLAPGTYQLSASIIGDDGSELAASNIGEIVIPAPDSTLQVTYGANASDRVISDSPTIELIFDASWSMTLPPDSDEEEDRLTADDPDSRIAIARDSMLRVVEELPTGIPVALRVFGNHAQPFECQTGLEVALAPLDNGAMADAIEAIEPQFNAMTPIGTSLNNVLLDIGSTDRPIKVVLLTDGQENCGIDPNSAIAGLRSYGIDVIVDVVGFAISDDDLKERFEAWALTGGGQYYDASDSDSLIAALESSIRPKYRVLDATGETVATGTIGGRALELDPGDYIVEILNGQEEQYDVTIGAVPTIVEIE